ncbi:hypothetical protein ZIOFF_063583 [Zingiber officinale]|uniref:non-specific serine/threonine protein kinase n=1 Tax=Zingiber officinale TaxID=94328 RepID=A0A8J5F579_ZINOF|nr:hypothetical protein ZIOFF_063583 [Zingiber officinale]
MLFHTLIKSSLDSDSSKRANGAFYVQPACIEHTSVYMFSLHALYQVSFPIRTKQDKKTTNETPRQQVATLPKLVVEPTTARSMSFVGTHEYLALEIIKDKGHGSAMDWWTFGIFLHELQGFSGNRARFLNLHYKNAYNGCFCSGITLQGITSIEATEQKRQHQIEGGLQQQLMNLLGSPGDKLRQATTADKLKESKALGMAIWGTGWGFSFSPHVGSKAEWIMGDK